VRLSAGNLERQIRDVLPQKRERGKRGGLEGKRGRPEAKPPTPVAVTYLEPDGVDHLAEHEEGQDPEGAEDGGEDELQPRPDVAVQGRVACGYGGRGETRRGGGSRPRPLLLREGRSHPPPAPARPATRQEERASPMICAVTD